MRHFGMFLLLVLALARASAQSPERPTNPFQAVDVFVDSGAAPLAAYQIEFKSKTGAARIVGIEGGAEATPFNAAPHYDPDAIKQERVVIADLAQEISRKIHG